MTTLRNTLVTHALHAECRQHVALTDVGRKTASQEVLNTLLQGVTSSGLFLRMGHFQNTQVLGWWYLYMSVKELHLMC